MGGKSSPPETPNYVGAAQAQGAANKDAAIASAQLSNPNVTGPYGSQTVSYSLDPTTGNPVPTVNQSLAPDQQALLSSQNSMQRGLADLGVQSIGTVQNVMGTPFNFNGPGVQTSIGNPNVRQGLDTSSVARMPVNAGTTALQASMQRLQPTMERQRSQLDTQLLNQGLRPGMEAYTNAMKDQDFRENDLYNQAVASSLGLDMNANQQEYGQALQSGQFGNQAAAQQFNQGQQQGQFANTAQAQSLAQQLAQYNQPLNQISALMGGSQVSVPQFQQYGGQQVQAAPIAGATQQAGQYAGNLYNAQVGQQNAMTGGLAQLGAAGIGAYGASSAASAMAPYLAYGAMFSDRRLKSNIERVGTHPLGIGIYEYDIFGERGRGLMAQELREVMPEAVLEHPSGYLMVDYARVAHG